MTTTTTPTTPTTHYRLSIELSPHTAPATHDDPGEAVILADLVATDDATGRRWTYIGSAPCATQGEALDLMARIFAWEKRGDQDRRLDPTRRADCWVEEVATVAHVEPAPAPAPAAIPAPAPVASPVRARGRRVKVDAGKARRARAGAGAAG